MPFDERFSEPRDGHELVCIDNAGVAHWCLRCGALWMFRAARPGSDDAASTWETPSAAGRAGSSVEAPPCRPSEVPGTSGWIGDARLMLRALTHGWRCEPVRLPVQGNAEAWRWSRDPLLGVESFSVLGAWADGPVIDDALRKRLLATTS